MSKTEKSEADLQDLHSKKVANKLLARVRNKKPHSLNPGDAIDYYHGDQPGAGKYRKVQ